MQNLREGDWIWQGDEWKFLARERVRKGMDSAPEEWGWGRLRGPVLTHQYLKVPLKIVVWIFGTFDNNLEIKIGFTKYLKKNCREYSD